MLVGSLQIFGEISLVQGTCTSVRARFENHILPYWKIKSLAYGILWAAFPQKQPKLGVLTS
jgi:hypothetical protein